MKPAPATKPALEPPTCVEVCAGGGGQALGLEAAGFEHLALVEIDHWACETLRLNRPLWQVIEGDLKDFSGLAYQGADLLSGGVPCPPFSVAGKQLGHQDERDLFPQALRLAREINPKAILLENVRGFLDPRFAGYRQGLEEELESLGYQVEWKLVQASDFGVPQLRPRVVIVALKKPLWHHFAWPYQALEPPPTVGQCLLPLMASLGWPGAKAWSQQANQIAPTLVGGSKKHGGPDLGPTRAKKAWAALGVDGLGLANEPPPPDFAGMPRLTVPMVARLQGFPPDWQFAGKKTPAYRQVGNAFPPPVAQAVAQAIRAALEAGQTQNLSQVG